MSLTLKILLKKLAQLSCCQFLNIMHTASFSDLYCTGLLPPALRKDRITFVRYEM